MTDYNSWPSCFIEEVRMEVDCGVGVGLHR
jgi:hypothetical protein